MNINIYIDITTIKLIKLIKLYNINNSSFNLIKYLS